MVKWVFLTFSIRGFKPAQTPKKGVGSLMRTWGSPFLDVAYHYHLMFGDTSEARSMVD